MALPGFIGLSSVSTSLRVTVKKWYLGFCQHQNFLLFVTKLKSCSLSEAFRWETGIKSPPLSVSLTKFFVAFANIVENQLKPERIHLFSNNYICKEYLHCHFKKFFTELVLMNEHIEFSLYLLHSELRRSSNHLSQYKFSQ